MPVRPTGDKPPRPVHPSAIDRHQLESVKPKTWVQKRNSMALPGIDVAAEIELINQGYGIRVGDSRYEINSRVYVAKQDGATYPESGDGIVSASR